MQLKIVIFIVFSTFISPMFSQKEITWEDLSIKKENCVLNFTTQDTICDVVYSKNVDSFIDKVVVLEGYFSGWIEGGTIRNQRGEDQGCYVNFSKDVISLEVGLKTVSKEMVSQKLVSIQGVLKKKKDLNSGVYFEIINAEIIE